MDSHSNMLDPYASLRVALYLAEVEDFHQELQNIGLKNLEEPITFFTIFRNHIAKSFEIVDQQKWLVAKLKHGF